MRYSELTAGRVATVAVIGGGASGTLAATYLLRAAAQTRTPLRIALIDRWGQHGLGRAYATQNPAHLLNSPVDRMSAVAGDPGHLARWAAANEIRHDGFLSRVAFGRYLRELLADAERTAAPTATVARITSDVVGLSYSGLGRPLRLHLAAQGRIDADAVVLATGNASPAAPFGVPASPRYIGDPWIPGALDGVADGSPVVVLGTGLTMLDVAISLTGAHPRTVVHAVSRHALVPREHRAPPDGEVQSPVLRVPDLDLPGLIRYVRVAAAQAPDGWQAVVDALRPHLPGLWRQLSLPDKRLFLRHVARYWEVHRHRVPPATARRIDQLRSAGRLSVQRGRIVAVAETPTGLCVRIEHGGRVTEVAAGWLINATGPAADITATTDPLLRGLLDSGLARPDPLRLGLEVDAGGALLSASGPPSDSIFALGPPLRGQLYETTAIPEIRDQAAALADRLLAACRAPVAPLAGKRGLAAASRARCGSDALLGHDHDGHRRAAGQGHGHRADDTVHGLRRAADHDHRGVPGVSVADARGVGRQLARDRALTSPELPALLAAAQLFARRGAQLPRDLVEVSFQLADGVGRQRVGGGQVSDVHHLDPAGPAVQQVDGGVQGPAGGSGTVVPHDEVQVRSRRIRAHRQNISPAAGAPCPAGGAVSVGRSVSRVLMVAGARDGRAAAPRRRTSLTGRSRGIASCFAGSERGARHRSRSR